MTVLEEGTRSIVLEREFAHSPEKVWRALTEGPLLELWLMPGDFQPVVGHPFTLRADPVPGWNGITQGEVLAVDPLERLVYTWNSTGAAADGLKTTVTWTLKPTSRGSLVRMEQSGFRSQDEPNFQGASLGWRRFVDRLERTLGNLERVQA